MNEAVVRRGDDVDALSGAALRAAALGWFVPAIVGQWFFAWHIAEVYLRTAFAGDLAAWNRHLFVGMVAGDVLGNAALVAHLFIAFVITLGGTLQLFAHIRRWSPAFHRWNGRVYVVIAFATSLTALYMIWTRETFGGILINDLSVSLDAVLIMLFAAIAWRHAAARRIDLHRRWALRTFMVASGVWFTRVIYAFLGAVPGETPGLNDAMSGATNIAIGFLGYLLPLALLELYFLASRSRRAPLRFATAALVLLAAVATSIGVYGTAVRWMS